MILIRSFETRLDLRSADRAPLGQGLEAYAALMSRVERRLLAQIKAGRKWTGDLQTSFYQPLGISSTHLGMIYRQLVGKLSSVSELAKERVNTLSGKIASKRTDIRRKEKALAKALAERTKLPQEIADLDVRIAKRRAMLAATKDSMRPKHLFVFKHLLDERHAKAAKKDSILHSIKALKFALHQHRRKLGSLEHRKTEAAAQAKDPTLCFGSRNLFRAQFALEENGYVDLDQWRKDWKSARSAQFTLSGDASMQCGNQFARLRKGKNLGLDLELRLPKGLAHLATRSFSHGGQEVHCIDFSGLSFNHGDDVVRKVLEAGKPVSVKFLRDDKSWKVYVSVDEAIEMQSADFSRGALGVDMNAGHISAVLVDTYGNPIESFEFPCVTYGKSSDQIKDTIRKVAADIARLAARLGVPVVSERLDFSSKKKALKADDGPRYARMLSSFSYSAFNVALASACLRSGLAHRRVNPAYTSIIGRVKFARRYGLSVHEAASVSIARRAMGCSERMPRSSDGTVTVPTNSSVHVALHLPARNDARHVWTEWNGLNKEYHKKALAARESSGRRPSRPGRWNNPSFGRAKTSAGRSDMPLHVPSAEAGRSR